MRRLFVFAAVAAFSVSAFASLTPASPFADGMVLQRRAKVPVWGTADAGAKVTVEFGGQIVSSNADEKGAWRVDLAPMDASAESRTLVISSGADKVSIADVLVGEVWYCCGQSNTELPLVGPNPHFRDRYGSMVAQLTRKPLVRFVCAIDIPRQMSVTPLKTAPYKVEWKKALPANLLNGPSFSAMGIYFALQLHSELNIPVGIIGSYWGGTNIDAWTPREGTATVPALKDVLDRPVIANDDWKQENASGPFSGPQQQPAVLWNRMVEPWCPYAIRGMIWYQGCNNAREPEAFRYCDKMHALYNGWSLRFENPSLKLYFVELAPFLRTWWPLQMEQRRFCREQRNAGMVTTADVGNSEDIHPNEKMAIGHRLAAMALHRDYGFEDVVCDAPEFRKGTVAEDGTVTIEFDNAKGWYVYSHDWGVKVPFELADETGKYHPAYVQNLNVDVAGGCTNRVAWWTTGQVKGKDLQVRAVGVTKPVKVRYLHEKPWVGNLFNEVNIPLGPFEADLVTGEVK